MIVTACIVLNLNANKSESLALISMTHFYYIVLIFLGDILGFSMIILRDNTINGLLAVVSQAT